MTHAPSPRPSLAPPLGPDAPTAPLWARVGRLLGAFIDWFGAPATIGGLGRLTQRYADEVRLVLPALELLVRRLLLADALTLKLAPPRPGAAPICPRAARIFAPVTFDPVCQRIGAWLPLPGRPDSWRVRFVLPGAVARSLPPMSPTPAPRVDDGRLFRFSLPATKPTRDLLAAAPIARRLVALMRVLARPMPVVRRLARRLAQARARIAQRLTRRRRRLAEEYLEPLAAAQGQIEAALAHVDSS